MKTIKKNFKKTVDKQKQKCYNCLVGEMHHKKQTQKRGKQKWNSTKLQASKMAYGVQW